MQRRLSPIRRFMSSQKNGAEFRISREEIGYKRYLTVWQRDVVFPEGHTVAWDVVGHATPNPAFATVFPFNTKTKRISALLYEYSQGPNAMCHTLVAGGFDPKKHASILDTAKQELSEEARLTGGQWIPLLPLDSQGVPELKWSRNQFMPFLVLNPEPDTNPLERDAEEKIEILPDVPLSEFKDLVLQGKVMLPSVQTAVMAIDWLKKNGHLPGKDDVSFI